MTPITGTFTGDSARGYGFRAGTVYTITYNYGGGSGSPSVVKVNAGKSTTLPTPTPATNYVNNGWYTAGSGGSFIGNGGSSYTPISNITLYAQYTYLPVGSHIYYASTLNTASSYTFTVPTGVTSISVALNSSGGGAYAFGVTTFFGSTAICCAYAAVSGNPGAFQAGSGGATGGISYGSPTYGGGGCGGYSSSGGAGGSPVASGASSTDGGGGGGGYSSGRYSHTTSGGGGGTDLYGANNGYNGAGGAISQGGNIGSYLAGGNNAGFSGGAGSSNQYGYGVGGYGAAYTTFTGPRYIVVGSGGSGGAAFGGAASGYSGGGFAFLNNYSVTPGQTYTIQIPGPSSPNGQTGGFGGCGVRVVWPGTTRQFPSTNVNTTTSELVN